MQEGHPCHLRLRGYLALVGALVRLLDVLDEQRPLVRRREGHAEPVVAGERVAAHRQDVSVTGTHPRHLSKSGHAEPVVAGERVAAHRQDVSVLETRNW